MNTRINDYLSSKGPRRWGLWLYISLSVLAAGIVFYFWYAAKQRQITKLKTAAVRAAVKAENVRYSMSVDRDVAELKYLASQANEWQHTADRLRSEIAKHEKEVTVQLTKVAELKSWKELDIYNKQGR